MYINFDVIKGKENGTLSHNLSINVYNNVCQYRIKIHRFWAILQHNSAFSVCVCK